MSNTESKKLPKNEHAILLKELQNRFGRDVATEIMDNVERVISSKSIPDYMPVKACSEMLELFRTEAKAILADLKSFPAISPEEDSTIIDLKKRKLEMEFRRTYRLYWISMGLFYPLYQRAITGCKDKIAAPYGTYSNASPTALAA